MCATATAKRRRRQAANQYRHLAPDQRPNYPRGRPMRAYNTVVMPKGQKSSKGGKKEGK